MAPYSVFTVGPNGHFVSVKEIMASSDAAALERARQLLDQLVLEGVERWAKNCGAVGPSANALAPDIVVRLDSARAALYRLGHVGGATLTRPSFGAGRGCRPEPPLRLYGARWRVFRPRPVDATVAKSISTRHPPPRARSIDWTTPLNHTTRLLLSSVNSVTGDFSRNDIRQRSASTSLWM